MPHKVEISDKTFDRLKEYCELNRLKIGQCADKLIFDGLMIEMYGDVPFTNYRKPPKEMIEIPVPEKMREQEEIPPEIQKVINEHFYEMLGDEKKVDEFTKMANAYESLEKESEDFKHSITDGVTKGKEILKQGEERLKQSVENLKQAGVPDKVVNKITKRRLK